MTVTRVTTVFDAVRALEDTLRAVTYPPHPDTGERPTVWDGTLGETPAEYVDVVHTVSDATSNFETFNKVTHSEVYEVQVMIHTVVPGNTRRDVLDRLELLVDTVGEALRSTTTGISDTLSIPGMSWTQARFAGLDTYPNDTQGYGGTAAHVVVFNAGRI